MMDAPSTGLLLFATIFLVIIGLIILTAFNREAQESTTFSPEAKSFVATSLTNLTSAGNWVIPIIYLGFLIISIVAAKRAQYSHAQLAFWVLMVAFIVVMLVIPSNIYDEAKQAQGNFSSVAESMPLSDYILDHMVEAGLIYFAVVGFVLFTRKEG